MAKKDLEKLADELLDQLKKDNRAFREQVSDTRTHYLACSVKSVSRQVIRQLKKRTFIKEKIPESIKKIIREEVPKLVTELHSTLTDTPSIKVTFQAASTSVDFVAIIEQRNTGGSVSIYNYLKKKKGDAQKPLAEALDKEIKNLNSPDKEREGTFSKPKPGKAGRKDKPYKFNPKAVLLDVGHMEGGAIAEERARAFNDVLFQFDNQKADSFARVHLKKILKKYGIKIVKIPVENEKGDLIHEVRVELEATSVNASKATLEKSGSIQKALEEILDRTDWPNQEGSDSPIEIVAKKSLNLFAPEDGKTRKTTRSNFKKQKIKNKSVTARSKTRERKINNVKPFVDKSTVAMGAKSSQGARRRAGIKSSSVQLQKLLGVLNSQLPSVVAGNMGPPRLSNVSGRFSRSVRATEITRTQGGFPSIGYTYQKRPYDTFEVGGTQGSPDYDPRKLIDMSIREVAASFAIGRFYTRRV